MPSFNEITGARISSGVHVKGTDKEAFASGWDAIWGKKTTTDVQDILDSESIPVPNGLSREELRDYITGRANTLCAPFPGMDEPWEEGKVEELDAALANYEIGEPKTIILNPEAIVRMEKYLESTHDAWVAACKSMPDGFEGGVMAGPIKE